MDKSSLDIVIVDYKTGDLILECLGSIIKHKPHYAYLDRVVIVDNATSYGTSQRLNQLELPIYIICNTSNRGFAAACNQGAVGSKADYLLFLNPDTRLMTDSLDIPVRFLDNPSNSSVGIVGIQLLYHNGQVARTCSYRLRLAHFINKMLALNRLFPRWLSDGMMDEWDHATSRTVDGVMGAFYLVRRALFDKLGGFDERFFMYFEEAEFGLRAWQAGFETYYLADASAYHEGHGSSKRIKPQRLFYSLQSRIRYGYKHFSRLSASILLVATIIIEPLSRIILACIRGSGSEIKDTVMGYKLLWLFLFDAIKAGEDGFLGRD
jgi:N-acetylglucosaminyl-diphospho-decaprenol L-rhamnosyltransferase